MSASVLAWGAGSSMKCLVVALAVFAAAWGTEAEADTNEELDRSSAAASESDGEAEREPAECIPASEGDIVTLRSGQVIAGFQVIRETHILVEIELVPNRVHLFIPRKMVRVIDYDDNVPARSEPPGESEEEVDSTGLIPGHRLATTLSHRLSAPLSDEPIDFGMADLLTIIEEVSTRSEVEIIVGQGVLDVPVSQRMWECKLQPGTTLRAFLQDNMLKHFTNLEVTYEYDKIRVALKRSRAPEAPPDSSRESQSASPAVLQSLPACASTHQARSCALRV
jgi:hypothetical protein